MTKIVINAEFGGFGLSERAIIRYCELIGKKVYPIHHDTFKFITYSLVPPEERIDTSEKLAGAPLTWHEMSLEEKQAYNETYRKQTFTEREIARDDPILVQVVQELGSVADGNHAQLKIVEIPDDVEWQIEEYDGNEWVAEKHRTWS